MDRDADPTRQHRPTGPESRHVRLRVTLWCGVCGRSHTYTREQVLEFIKSRWPVCCGRTMGLGRASPPPETSRPAS
jgi:hypothetical protein